MGEIRALTGLRGVGAVLVLAYHLCLASDAPTLHGILLRGYLAVDLFFILSGFVLAGRYGALVGFGQGGFSYPRFLLRRFARLWPMHVTFIGVMAAVDRAVGAASPWPHEVMANVAMAQAWGLSQSIDIPSWSVSTEWAAAVLYPLLAWITLRGNWRMAGVAAGGAALLLVYAALQARGIPHGRRGALDIYDGWSVLPLLRCLAGFTIGLLSWRLAASPARAMLAAEWVAPSCAVLLGVGAACGVSDLLLYPLLPPMVGALAMGGGAFGRWLATPVPRAAGRLSYAVYLAHMPVIVAWAALAPPASWPAVPVVVLAVSILAYRLIERPCRACLIRIAGQARFATATS